MGYPWTKSESHLKLLNLHKFNSKQVTNLNVKHKTMKLKKKNVGEFWDQASKA
jgi:hypothetical protein